MILSKENPSKRKYAPLENKHHSKINTRKSPKKENKHVLIIARVRYSIH